MQILVPIFVCVVLPVAVVLIYSLQRRNSDNKRAEILIKAIEANKDIDVDRLTEAMSVKNHNPNPVELRNRRLLRGCIFSLIGLMLVMFGFISFSQGSDFEDDNVYCPMLFGCISAAVGFSYLIVYYISRNQQDTENSRKNR